MAEKTPENRSSGIRYGILAYTAWGILPLYWKLLDMLPAADILAHRILWSFLFVGFILLVSGGWRNLLAALAEKRNLLLAFCSSLLISLNWFTYIWAVNANHVLETSIGYYLNPLVLVMLGMTVLKERLDQRQGIALSLAAAGVLIITIQYGRIPWIALVLAGTFAFYGLIKKLLRVDAVTGLALETFMLMPVALIYIVGKEVKGPGILGTTSFLTIITLLGSGIVTAMPLLWFAKGARRIQLSVMGFLQYIAPTISLFLGIFVFKEDFSVSHLLSFGFIWAGLFVFSLSQFKAAPS